MTSFRGVSRATLTAQLADAIRTDIIEGRLAPGQRLRAIELTERYNVSATPLREALQRLAAQNLIEIDPRIGARVTPVSPAHLHDTYWMRQLLETRALERSIGRGDEDWERQVRLRFEEFRLAVESADDDDDDDGPSGWSHAHRAFHEALLAACDSPWLLSLLSVLNDHAERYRVLSPRAGSRDPIKEHQEIFERAVARDTDQAVEFLGRHLDRTVESIERWAAVNDHRRD
jgi:DNA-binding GntR family transcriptional regulator